MQISIETRDAELAADLEAALADKPDADFAFELLPRRHRLTPFDPIVIQAAVGFGSAVAAGICSNWLWEIVAGRATKIKVGDEVLTDLDAAELKRLLERRVAGDETGEKPTET